MKKQIIKIISFVMVFVIAIYAFAGCELGGHGTPGNIFPEGYTGGFGLQPGSPLEYWWVETYEECIDAIELLKSHGSTFKTDYVYACEEDLFDVKYFFITIGNGRHGERIKFGDNPFDRWVYDIQIGTIVFFDDVTIDELVYSYTSRYEAYGIDCGPAYQIAYEESFNTTDLTIGDWMKFGAHVFKQNQYYKIVSYCEQPVIQITTSFYVLSEEAETREYKMNDECINYIINSGKIIELNKE